jgi:hypothetical protein
MSQRIEAGIYRGRGAAGSEQYGETKNANDQIVLDLDLLDLGERVSTFLVFSEKAAPWSIKRLRALGWTGDSLADLTGIDSSEVDVEVKYEEYNGELKMKVQIIVGGTVTLENQFDDKAKKAFAAKHAALVKSTAAPRGAARPAAKPPANARPTANKPASGFGDATGTDDDIPF